MASEGFFGLALSPGKSYSQTVDVPFKLTMAAIGLVAGGAEAEEALKGKRCSVMIRYQGKMEFVLCSLALGRQEQQTLDLYFVEGDEICFFATGEWYVKAWLRVRVSISMDRIL